MVGQDTVRCTIRFKVEYALYQPNGLAGDSMLSIGLKAGMMRNLLSLCIVLFCFRPHILCNAQDVMERIKQFDIESISFDVPNIVHFDISVFEEMPATGGVRGFQLLGRTMRLSEFQLRTEYLYEEIAPKVGDRRKELYLQHSPQQKVLAEVGATDIPFDFYSTSYDKLTAADGQRLREANPYTLLLNGAGELGRAAGKVKPVQFLRTNFVPLQGVDHTLVQAERAAVVKLEFDSRDPWKIVSFANLYPGGSPLTLREFKKKVSSIEDCKDFLPVATAEAKWMELKDGTHVPFWIYHRRENLNGSNPGQVSEMEAFFFSIDTEPHMDERLFDPERITHEEWKKDFKVEEIEALAKREREKLLRDEKKSRSSAR